MNKDMGTLSTYRVGPLPAVLLSQLPEMRRGQRIVAIREARGISRQIDLREMAKLSNSTCASMEADDAVPSPIHLYVVSRVLRVDPLLIVFGRDWKEVSLTLPDNEKMSFLRLRRGWTQADFALKLEQAGLVFETKRIDSKRTTVTQWEKGVVTPEFKKRRIIRKVLKDKTLFQSSQFDVFTTIKLGSGPRNAEGFLKNLSRRGLSASEDAGNLLYMPGFAVVDREMEVDLVKVSADDLGFYDGASTYQICMRAMKWGLRLCPAETGPQLCLQGKNLAEGDRIVIGMDLIRDSEKDLSLFRVERVASETQLESIAYADSILWPAKSQWVFILPRCNQKWLLANQNSLEA